MAKIVRFKKSDTYLDSSNIRHKGVDLKTYISYLEGKRSVIHFDSTIGWKRIAILDGLCNGDLIITNPDMYGTVGKIIFGSDSGWDTFIQKIFKVYTNGQYFTKMRLVTCGGCRCYLEIYQNLAKEKDVSLFLDLSSINVTLYTTQTMGNVPNGYNVKEITF